MQAATIETSATAINWVGTHSAIALSKVLKRIANEEKSGDLQVNLGEAVKTIYCDSGRVVFAASTIKDDRLGETMVETGCISEREFILASSLMKVEGRKFGEALVRMGFITREKLEHQLCHQFNRIVCSLFNVKDGIYSFEERTSSIPKELMVRLPIPHLLLEGLRKVEDENLLLSYLPSAGSRLRTVAEALSNLDRLTLGPIERGVLHAARDGATLEAILEDVEGHFKDVLRACSALYAAGFLKPSDLSPRPRDLDKKIRSEFGRSDEQPESKLLQVGSGADPEALEKAYRLKRLEWSQAKRLVENERSLVLKVSEIQFRLAAAYHRLLMERQRPSASADGPASPTTIGAPPSIQAEESNSVPQFRQGGVEMDNKEAPARCSPPPADLETKARMEKLVRDLKLHLSIRDWEGAIPLLFELVELEPKNPRYRALLAKSMFRHPGMRKNAEGHFLEAIRLAPQNADLHVWLGAYYKTFRMGVRAERHLRTALRIDPDNQQAKKLLSNGTGKGALDQLKKMFT